jgi:hypothetical protein
MKNRTSILVVTRHFFYALLAVVIFSSCDDQPVTRIWYGDNGMVVESKSTNEIHYGKWKYIIRDNYGEILIRTNEEWNVSDTLYIGKHYR